MEKKIEDMSFEEGIAELEALSKQMTKGSLSLDESLKVYERGVKLSKHCKKLLDKAQKKIQILDEELSEADSEEDDDDWDDVIEKTEKPKKKSKSSDEFSDDDIVF